MMLNSKTNIIGLIFACYCIVIGSMIYFTAGCMRTTFPLVDEDRQAIIIGHSLFLHDAVEKCTGIKLEQISEEEYKPENDKYPVYIGITKKAQEVLAADIERLDIEGYMYFVSPAFAIIYAGKPKSATGDPQLWAEANFARMFFGVDQYIPGQLGEEYPKHKKILIPCGKYIETPAFKHRHWSGFYGAGGSAWRVGTGGGVSRYPYEHNLYNIINPDIYRSHPEYFPIISPEERKINPLYQNLKEAQRYIPAADKRASGWQPCISNPDVYKIVVDNIMEYFAKRPQELGFSLGVNDGYGYCYCDECLKMTSAGIDPWSPKGVTYRYFEFYNKIAGEVAGKYPDKRLCFLAYHGAADFENYSKKLHPMIMPYLPQSQADCFDPEYREKINNKISALGKIAAHFGLYEYLYGKGFIIPRIYTRQLAEGLRHARKCGADALVGEAYANWGLDGPKLWILEKLLWDPDQDENKLLITWCNGMFKEAGLEMRDYFIFLEKVWVEQKPSDKKRGGYRLFNRKKEQLTEVFPPIVCDKAWDLLEQAERAAKQEIVKKRIAYFKASFGVTRLASYRYNTAKAYEEEMITKKAGIIDFLIDFNKWAALQPLDKYMDELRPIAPFAFQELCYEHLVEQRDKTKIKQSFADWDTEFSGAPIIISRILSEILSSGSPTNRQELGKRIEDYLNAKTQEAKNRNSSCQQAVALLKPILLNNAGMDMKIMACPPAIDGIIDPVWGEPCFDGNFCKYQSSLQLDDNRTKIWIGSCRGKLHIAFYCYQDPGTILNNLKERDAVELLENKMAVYRWPGFPYFTGVDSVGFLLPAFNGNNQLMGIVTSAGGICDLKFEDEGFGRGGWYTSWDGIKAEVKKTNDGWCAEMEITMEESILNEMMSPGIKYFNFFRSRNGALSAWKQAEIDRWTISPLTRGMVFIP